MKLVAVFYFRHNYGRMMVQNKKVKICFCFLKIEIPYRRCTEDSLSSGIEVLAVIDKSNWGPLFSCFMHYYFQHFQNSHPSLVPLCVCPHRNSFEIIFFFVFLSFRVCSTTSTCFRPSLRSSRWFGARARAPSSSTTRAPTSSPSASSASSQQNSVDITLKHSDRAAGNYSVALCTTNHWKMNQSFKII